MAQSRHRACGRGAPESTHADGLRGMPVDGVFLGQGHLFLAAQPCIRLGGAKGSPEERGLLQSARDGHALELAHSEVEDRAAACVPRGGAVGMRGLGQAQLAGPADEMARAAFGRARKSGVTFRFWDSASVACKFARRAVYVVDMQAFSGPRVLQARDKDPWSLGWLFLIFPV